MNRPHWIVLFLTIPLTAAADDGRKDVVIADFESDGYGDWKSTGTAFGPGPARGALPGQMHVEGFVGRGLVNSFHGGDDATGTLVSPPFQIERKALNFLIGGGKYPGETCINLLIDDRPARTATGPNDRPGGSERLSWQGWDVAEFAGKTARIEIVDRRKGGWGHINVDQIVQSDVLRSEGPARRALTVEANHLNLPVKAGAPARRLSLLLDGKPIRELDIALADGAPDLWVPCDVSKYRGKSLTLAVDLLPSGSKALEQIDQGDDLKGEPLYRETLRPQFHFTARRGWLNDPNGLVYLAGEYHLFFQHNPYGWDWGNMHWGHAVSPDLVHWTELPDAIEPYRYGDWAFSGSAVVDLANTSGFQTGKEPPMVAAYTSTARGECIVFSNDRGRTWTEFAGNPVVKHQGRDPRLLWHEPTKRWVMAVYDEPEGKRWVAFHTSPDLKHWEFGSRIENFFECPDLYELPVAGKTGESRWVLSAADGEYLLGRFDGKEFHKESGKHRLWYGNFYAAQTFSNAPDGRRVQIGWGQGIAFPGMPFNQQMTFPCELTLRPTPDGPRLHAAPVAEIASLRGRRHAWTDVALAPDESKPLDVSGDLYDIAAEITSGDADAFGLNIRGVPIVYDAHAGTLSCHGKTAPLATVDGVVRLRVLVDRGSIEIFGDDGRVALSVGVIPAEKDHTLAVFTRGCKARVKSLEVFELKSAWSER